MLWTSAPPFIKWKLGHLPWVLCRVAETCPQDDWGKTALAKLFCRNHKSEQYWGIVCAQRAVWLSHQGADWDLLPFLPWPSLFPYSSSKQRLRLKRTIPCSMIKGTMGFLGSSLGPKAGGQQSRMPNKPGYSGASQKQNSRLGTKDLARLCLSALVTHPQNSWVPSGAPILGKPEIWNLNVNCPRPWKLLVWRKVAPRSGDLWLIVCHHRGQWAQLLKLPGEFVKIQTPTFYHENFWFWRLGVGPQEWFWYSEGLTTSYRDSPHGPVSCLFLYIFRTECRIDT